MKFTNEQIEQGLDKIFDNLLQTKDVEASESMEITPDEGYAGIKKVNLTVKGGGESGGGGEKIYAKPADLKKLLLDTGADEATAVQYAVMFLGFCTLVRLKTAGKGGIMLPAMSMGHEFSLESWATDEYTLCRYDIDETISINGSLKTLREDEEIYGILTAMPHYTEEEFYNINA